MTYGKTLVRNFCLIFNFHVVWIVGLSPRIENYSNFVLLLYIRSIYSGLYWNNELVAMKKVITKFHSAKMKFCDHSSIFKEWIGL